MSQSRSVALICTCLATLMGPSFVLAQAAPEGTRLPRAARSGLAPAEVVAMLDAYAVVQSQDALQLNDTH